MPFGPCSFYGHPWIHIGGQIGGSFPLCFFTETLALALAAHFWDVWADRLACWPSNLFFFLKDSIITDCFLLTESLFLICWSLTITCRSKSLQLYPASPVGTCQIPHRLMVHVFFFLKSVQKKRHPCVLCQRMIPGKALDEVQHAKKPSLYLKRHVLHFQQSPDKHQLAVFSQVKSFDSVGVFVASQTAVETTKPKSRRTIRNTSIL